ncbi:hypothetical protein [Kutzneria sp. 744]|uniref:hypothetical protein n=1 Tax=Kutzneria sp. (strain 744) TaxID=345341 RepID=UPI0003EEBE48|nr:hypothetical protein [Kutzneria sp. 744]EWM14598.1 hypothetical protein KUTG_04902 [Kutzneria sp. 744]
MDDPGQDGEDDFAGLASIEGERPTTDARLRIEKEGMRVVVSVPPNHASHLLDAAVAALLVIAALCAPAVTLKAAPEGLPNWAVVGMITIQLGVVILVTLRIFTNKPGSSSRLSG